MKKFANIVRMSGCVYDRCVGVLNSKLALWSFHSCISTKRENYFSRVISMSEKYDAQAISTCRISQLGGCLEFCYRFYVGQIA